MQRASSRHMLHDKRGSILIIVAFFMVGLLSFVALVTDIGYAYYQKARIENAVSAGWKAGMDLACTSATNDDGTLTSSAEAAILTRIRDVVQLYYPGHSFSGGPLVCNITFANSANSADTRHIRKNLRVEARFDSPMFFAQLIGYPTMPVAAGRGGDPTDNGGEGVIPIGLPHGILRQLDSHTCTFEKFDEDDAGFIPGEEYIIRLGNLKSSQADTSCSNCGGDGIISTAGSACTSCGGKGQYHDPTCSFCGGDGIRSNGKVCDKGIISCTVCGGDGVIGGSTSSCTVCGGDGIVEAAGIPDLRTASNHGSLDMGSKGGGANEYREFFKFGYPGSVELFDELMLKTGTMKGPNDEGRDYRINNGLERVVVPIVKSLDDDLTIPQEQNGSGGNAPSVVVIGFAVFDLIPVSDYTTAPLPSGLGAYDPDKDSDQVRGRFVKYIIKPS